MGQPLEIILINIPFNILFSSDINLEQMFIQAITEKTLAIGLGEAWTFNQATISKFNGRLIDLMGIRMPQYRGGGTLYLADS